MRSFGGGEFSLYPGILIQTKGRSIFQATCPLYLASASPRRIEFFNTLGLQAESIRPPEEAEPSPLPGENPAAYALRAAHAKAAGVLAGLPESQRRSFPAPLVIAADTVVVLDSGILGKPRDPEHAFAMLCALSGKTHTVTTGCAILSPSLPEPRSFAAHSRVHMWNCPKELLLAYARSGEPLDKAGAYAVQGAGAFLVQSIEGSWSNVVGLPLAELIQTLLDMKALRPAA